ncbi:MAG: serine hydrolase [Deltaproteobacteria bacterium]|nr:serine hydrolase [Deltaproteobacteria bacterium]
MYRLTRLFVAISMIVASQGSAFGDSSDTLPSHLAALPPHLAALRLHGPVLIEGQAGSPLEQRMGDLNVHGVSVAVCGEGTVHWAEGWGFADTDSEQRVTPKTLFQAASISKPVSAAGVLLQAQAGKLALDRDVNEYLTSWRLPDSEFNRNQAVTLERILSHGGGLTVHGFRGYAADEALPTVVQVLDGVEPANSAPVRVDLEPGSRFRYSGGGFTVAQLALSNALGEPFPKLLERTVLRPASMNDSTFEQPLPAAKRPQAATGYRGDGARLPGKHHTYPEMAAAGLWTTPSDLCSFAMSVQSSRAGEDGALLGKAMAERMTTPVNGDAGLGFFIRTLGDEMYFAHGGANEGFRSMLIASRDGGFAAAVMVNSDNGSQLADEILRGIAQRKNWPGYLPEPLPNLPLSEKKLAAITGRYRVHGDEAFAIDTADGQLTMRSSDGNAVPLFQVAPGTLARMDREWSYRVEREDARVTGILQIMPGRGGEEERTLLAGRMGEQERLPMDWLIEGNRDKAVAAYRNLHREHPDDRGVAEDRLNQLGYRLAGSGEIEQALAVLEANTQLYPMSANAYDSLAEITLASGNRERALQLYRKVLQVLPRDSKASEDLGHQLRVNAERKLRELGSKK